MIFIAQLIYVGKFFFVENIFVQHFFCSKKTFQPFSCWILLREREKNVANRTNIRKHKSNQWCNNPAEYRVNEKIILKKIARWNKKGQIVEHNQYFFLVCIKEFAISLPTDKNVQKFRKTFEISKNRKVILFCLKIYVPSIINFW